ncbi:hypothetical protein LTR93_011157 [Exophiala xenobiotica]|nr:hypothetical protein LTR93_011157 [Exophiala xenobiotica]
MVQSNICQSHRFLCKGLRHFLLTALESTTPHECASLEHDSTWLSEKFRDSAEHIQAIYKDVQVLLRSLPVESPQVSDKEATPSPINSSTSTDPNDEPTSAQSQSRPDRLEEDLSPGDCGHDGHHESRPSIGCPVAHTAIHQAAGVLHLHPPSTIAGSDITGEIEVDACPTVENVLTRSGTVTLPAPCEPRSSTCEALQTRDDLPQGRTAVAQSINLAPRVSPTPEDGFSTASGDSPSEVIPFDEEDGVVRLHLNSMDQMKDFPRLLRRARELGAEEEGTFKLQGDDVNCQRVKTFRGWKALSQGGNYDQFTMDPQVLWNSSKDCAVAHSSYAYGSMSFYNEPNLTNINDVNATIDSLTCYYNLPFCNMTSPVVQQGCVNYRNAIAADTGISRFGDWEYPTCMETELLRFCAQTLASTTINFPTGFIACRLHIETARGAVSRVSHPVPPMGQGTFVLRLRID